MQYISETIYECWGMASLSDMEEELRGVCTASFVKDSRGFGDMYMSIPALPAPGELAEEDRGGVGLSIVFMCI